MFKITAQEKQFILNRRKITAAKLSIMEKRKLLQKKEAGLIKESNALLPDILSFLKTLKIEPVKTFKATRNSMGMIPLLGKKPRDPVMEIMLNTELSRAPYKDKVAIEVATRPVKPGGDTGLGKIRIREVSLNAFKKKFKTVGVKWYNKLKEAGANEV